MRVIQFWLAFVLGALGTCSLLHAAAPTVISLYPAGLQQGTSTKITLSGSWTAWPIKIDGELVEGLSVNVLEEAGSIEIQAADSVPAGPYYFRIYDAEGASNLIPFVVDSVPELQEKEPNAKPGEWSTIALPAVMNGRLKESGDVDVFGIAMEAGETVSLVVTANTLLGSPMDGILQLADDRGFTVAQNDDERNIDPQLTFTATKSGTYQVRLFAFPTTPNSTIGFSAASTYVYRLTAAKGKFLDFCLPLAQNSGLTSVTPAGAGFDGSALEAVVSANGHLSLPGVPGSVAVANFEGNVAVLSSESSEKAPVDVATPVSLSGVLQSREETHVVKLKEQKQGTTLAIKAFARTIGFPTDPLIQIIDAEGKVLSTQDDKSRNERDPEFSYKVPADGDYLLSIRDLHRQGGARFAYRVDVKVETPQVSITVAQGEFIKTKDNLEIPVTVLRSGGFNKVVDVAVQGLPEGLTAEVVKSEASGDSAKAVKLVVKGEPQVFSGSITISGTFEDGAVEATYLLKNSTDIQKRIWLTVLPPASE